MITSYSLLRTHDTTVNTEGRGYDGVAASSTSVYYSDVWKGDVDFGLTVETTGTLTGTWTLWASDNPAASATDDTHWVDSSTHADFVETNPAGSTTKWRVNSVLIRAGKLRLKYTNASGTGNIFAYVTRS